MNASKWSHDKFDGVTDLRQKVGAAKAAKRPAVVVPKGGLTTGTKVTISNLDTAVTQQDMKDLFETIGPLKSAKMTAVGMAEVVFKQAKDANTAFAKYNNVVLDGKRRGPRTVHGPFLLGYRGLGCTGAPELMLNPAGYRPTHGDCRRQAGHPGRSGVAWRGGANRSCPACPRQRSAGLPRDSVDGAGPSPVVGVLRHHPLASVRVCKAVGLEMSHQKRLVISSREYNSTPR